MKTVCKATESVYLQQSRLAGAIGSDQQAAAAPRQACGHISNYGGDPGKWSPICQGQQYTHQNTRLIEVAGAFCRSQTALKPTSASSMITANHRREYFLQWQKRLNNKVKNQQVACLCPGMQSSARRRPPPGLRCWPWALPRQVLLQGQAVLLRDQGCLPAGPPVSQRDRRWVALPAPSASLLY